MIRITRMIVLHHDVAIIFRFVVTTIVLFLLLLPMMMQGVVVVTAAHNGGSNIIQIDGSGSVSSIGCIVDIMDQIETTASVPVKMSYRSIGTTQALNEFQILLATTTEGSTVSPTPSLNDTITPNYPLFVVSDRSIDNEKYLDMNVGGTIIKKFVQLPLMVTPINFFHNTLVQDIADSTSILVNISNTDDDSTSSNIDDNIIGNDNTGPLLDRDGSIQLQLTPCLLAKIFTLKISSWNHPDIVAVNPTIKNKLRQIPIQVIVYTNQYDDPTNFVTTSITNYLYDACPEEFPENLVGNTPNWTSQQTLNTVLEYMYVPVGTGEMGMIDLISTTDGSIGFVSAGAAYTSQYYGTMLQEVLLPSPTMANEYMSLQESIVYDSIAPIIERDQFPASPDDVYSDVTDVTFINKKITASTWPIIVVSYLIVPKNISLYVNDDPVKRYLFYKFLDLFYRKESIESCSQNNFLTLLQDDVQQFARTGIQLVRESDPLYNADNKTNPYEWRIEQGGSNTTDPIVSILESPYVLSYYKHDHAAMTRRMLQQKVSELQLVIDDYHDVFQMMQQQIINLKSVLTTLNGGQPIAALDDDESPISMGDDPISPNSDNNDGNDDIADVEAAASLLGLSDGSTTDKLQKQVKSALVLSSLSFIWCTLVTIYYLYRLFNQPRVITEQS